MPDEKKEEKALELAKEAVKDLNEMGKDWTQAGIRIPFLSTFFAFTGLAIAQWEKRKFEEFLDWIRIPLAFDNIGQVGAHIAQNIHHRWMADGLAQGWRLGLETMDDTARKCAYNMVADYIGREKIPDRTWHQLARVFVASDEKILRMLFNLSEVLLRSKKDTCIIGTSQNLKQGYFEYVILPLGGDLVELGFAKEEFSVEAACEVAVLANLGVHWSDPSIQDNRPGHELLHRICQVDPHHREPWEKLQRYLVSEITPGI